jgi:hypothetical protein
MKNDKKKHAMMFHMTFRLIDDLIALENPYFQKYALKDVTEGGIYPLKQNLVLKCTTVTSEERQNAKSQQKERIITGVFAGASIEFNVTYNRYRTGMYDKTKDFPFVMNRFPCLNPMSNLPINLAYNSFYGYLHMAEGLSSTSDEFQEHIGVLVDFLTTRGYSIKRLSFLIRKYVTFAKDRSKNTNMLTPIWKGRSPQDLVISYVKRYIKAATKDNLEAI